MIRVVTDSTSYLPVDVIQAYNIPVVPLKVQFGTETYDEITGISNDDFYRRLTTTPDFPTTSQPAVGDFKKVCQKILADNPETQILILTVSARFSGTYSSAVTAAEQLPEANITVFDTLSVAMGLGLMTITAAQMAAEGHGLTSIIPRLERMQRETNIFLVVDTLEYLKRGGRIGAATAFLGNLLNTKPILAVVEGQVQPLDRVRTKKKAIDRLFAELNHKLPNPDQPIQAGVMHVAAETEAKMLIDRVRDHFNVTYDYISELGPVVGAHVGPGTVGVGFCPQAS
ncbi:MAG TPA: DegV family protein [Anaerolineae bacterium]|jgi:DegV family protein with EDD domain